MIKLPEGYIERPVAEGVDLVSRAHGRFKGMGVVMPDSQREIYEHMNDLFIEDVKSWRWYRS